MKAIVTGGNRGIGRAISTALGEAGYAISNLSRSQGVDVADLAAVEAAAARIGPVDLLVNNAGTFDAIGPAWAVDPADWRRDVQSSLVGAFNCVRAVLPPMLDRGQGRIVNVTSGAGTRAYPYGSGYAAAKAAMISFTQSLAAETADTGVAVFAITPGFVWTKMTERLRDAAGPAPDVSSARAVEPELGAQLVVRLASGRYDALSGRFLHALDDLDELIND
jgi:NAD(P)-dependent dehydrogenase (short-subunit alcohol dehydrogenase family)